MKLKVQTVMNATVALTTIINDQRPMPNRGHYLIARMHAKLLPEFQVIDARRDEMIKAYNTPQTRIETNAETGEKTEVQTDGWKVPADKMSEFTEAWKVIGAEEIEVDVQPIPLLSLSLGDQVEGPISSAEFITLGELITD